MNQIKEFAPSNVKIMIVGNKSDLKNDRVIGKEGGEECARKFGVRFGESSALTGEGVTEIFEGIGREIIKDFDPEGSDGEKLEVREKKKRKCC